MNIPSVAASASLLQLVYRPGADGPRAAAHPMDASRRNALVRSTTWMCVPLTAAYEDHRQNVCFAAERHSARRQFRARNRSDLAESGPAVCGRVSRRAAASSGARRVPPDRALAAPFIARGPIAPSTSVSSSSCSTASATARGKSPSLASPAARQAAISPGSSGCLSGWDEAPQLHLNRRARWSPQLHRRPTPRAPNLHHQRGR